MRDFLKYTFATLLGILIFLGLSIGGLLTIVVLLASRDTEPEVKNKSVLVYDLSLNITDARRSANSLGEVLSDDQSESITLRSAVNALDEAAKDPRIVALYLYGTNEGGGAGFAALKEVREALQRFRDSGKKIIAYDMRWREREYYLGSVANTILLNPIGSLEMNGLSSEGTFFAEALRKLGVGIQVTRVGKYKSAVEPLLFNKRSDADRQQNQTLLNDLWQEFLTTTAKDRKRTPQQIQTIADREGILVGEDALKQGLVDRLAYQDEVIDELKKLGGSEQEGKTFRQISLKNYAKVAEDATDRKRNSKNEVAVVYAEGDIVDGQGDSGEVGGDKLARQLRRLRQDNDVKAVVLRVNSPGGSVTASEVIQREVVLTRKAKKPVVVSMGTVAASGGYWISTDSDRIFAEPNTITGSIGVFGIQPNLQQLANRNGITWDVVKTGKLADSLSISRPKSPEEMALLQKNVDRIYDQFLTKVSQTRRLDKAKVAEIAQGRVWSGRRAKDLGLVDELGGLDAAIQDAAKRANLGNDWRIEEYPRVRSFEERLFGRFAGDQLFQPKKADPLTTEFNKFKADLTALQAMNDPLGIYVRLPFNLRID